MTNRLKIILLFLFFNTFAVELISQTYANDWINYNQTYYRFKVYKDGIYRINYSDLLSAGLPVGSISPQNFQIFGRGVEQYIYVKTQISGVMSSGDYIEFYAQKNDGWYDSILYKHPEYQLDKSYSLFTDTAEYFLTFNTAYNNKRLSLETSINYTSYTVEPYVFKTIHANYNDEYLEGLPMEETNEGTLSDPEYTYGEGFYSYAFYLGGSRSYNISTKNAFTTGPAAQVKFSIYGASNYQSISNGDHHVRIQFAGNTIDTIFDGYKILRYNLSTSAASLSSTNTNFLFSSINDLNSGADRNAVSFIEIKYPHTLNFEGINYFEFSIPDASQNKNYLNISNFSGGNNPVLYDLKNHRKILVTKNGSNYQCLIPNSGSEKNCVLVSEALITNGVNLTPVGNFGHFKNYLSQNPNADYFVITHKSLMGNGQTQYTSNDYVNYRNTTGNHAVLVDIDDLYEQFSYGISKNPMAIRNFVAKAFAQLSTHPKYLFIIGKAYYPDEYRKNTTYYNQTLVPSFGSPPSDILLTARAIDSTFLPALATGRLVAKNINHVDLYLNKVMQYEDPLLNPPAEWMKKALFFSGGDVASLQSIIATYMKGYEKIYEDTNFGGSVKTFYKTTTDPIQINLSAQIKVLIDGGVNMLSFFGHAAGIGFDISIDNPSEYNNYGKYPFLIANSCFAGDIFQPNVGIDNSSEAFILIRDKGAIAYLGSITSGFPAYLNLYTKEYFKNYCQTNYGKSIGSSIINTIAHIYSNTPKIKEVSLEMALHGDPALILNAHQLPDYMVNQSSIFFIPEIVTTEKDSFETKIVVTNIGKAVNDSIVVEIVRTLPNLNTQEKRYYQRGTYFKDTLSVWFPINNMIDVGKNTLSVRVDANSNITELSESNNNISVNFNVIAADLKPVFPAEFAIISTNKATLKASTFYPLSKNVNYIFEIDTTIYFNSPLMETGNIISSGGVIEYQPMLTFSDSVVYYWRVGVDSTSTNSFNWRNSSFQYIQGQKGWAQSDFFQFEHNNYQFAVFNKALRKFEFVNDIKILKCINGIYPYIGWTEPQYQINNIQQSYWQCVSNGMKIAVINPISGKPWFNHDFGDHTGVSGSFQCKGYDYPAFEFSTESTVNFPTNPPNVPDSIWFRRMANFIGTIPNGHYVLATSAANSHATSWPEYLYKSYDSIGTNFIRNIPDNRPYISWGIKGLLGGSTEVIGDSLQAHILLVDSFNTKWTQGFIASPIIGPSSKWYAINWKVISQDAINTDSVRLALVGYKLDGSKTTIFSDMPPDSSNISKLNNIMPAADYPYCQLICYMKDDSLHTPTYIKYWQVLFSEVPEIAIEPKDNFTFHSDTIERGDTMRISLAYKNISDINLADSILVSYWLIDNQNIRHDFKLRRVNKILANTFIVDTFSLITTNLVENCYFNIDINTINPTTQNFDQLEITHSNNSFQIPFYVKKDNSNPLLDVTFDGIHILDGDIVSAKPEILISLNDDNKFIPLDDTSSFKIYITEPGNLARRRIYFFSNGEEQMQFIAAEMPKNKSKIIYRPDFKVDGIYKLYAQAVDPSLNIAGLTDYQLTFNVINKATITNLMNWPNPFTTKTHFVFTLTGSQIPDYLLIQIMTISGKVIKEIGIDEIGEIHIGRNISTYAWDGTDEFGDRLANGVYLYRVITRINGKDIEHRNSAADTYFKNNFGKIYLMR